MFIFHNLLHLIFSRSKLKGNRYLRGIKRSKHLSLKFLPKLAHFLIKYIFSFHPLRIQILPSGSRNSKMNAMSLGKDVTLLEVTSAERFALLAEIINQAFC